MAYVGEYRETTDYVLGNQVTYAGGVYEPTRTVRNVLPTDTTYWRTSTIQNTRDRGAWSVGTEYSQSDSVYYSGARYVAKTRVAEFAPTNNSEYWYLYSAVMNATLVPDLVPSTATTGNLTPGQLARINATAGAATRTLPLAASAGVGALVAIRKTDATTNTITVARAGSDTINASTSSRVMTSPEVAITLVSDGVSNWSVVNTDVPTTALSATYATKRQVVEHTSSASNQTVPADIQGAIVTIITGGYGGGSGRRGAAGTIRGGGGSGSTGAVWYEVWIPASFFGTTYSVAVGAGGAGGGAASVTQDAQAGAAPAGYGVGGAGGGASLNGFNSGAGANGGPGYVRITWIF